MEDADFKPLVSFPDQSPSFTLGFEAGMVWQRMQAGEEIIENGTPYHSLNAHEVFQGMCDAAGYEMEAKDCEDTDGEWTEVVFYKVSTPRPKLTVVTNNTPPETKEKE